MSKKSQQKAATKRARREVVSKQKRAIRQARGVQILPGSRPVSPGGALTPLAMALARSNLEDPMKVIMKGRKSDGTVDVQELIKTSRQALKEVYKLFTYTTLAERMVKQNIITHDFACDLDRITAELIEIDRQVLRLPKLAEVDIESFMVDLLDIGGYIENIADKLYSEIESLEKNSIVIEERLNRSAHDFQVSHPEVTEQDARVIVMESISQDRITAARQVQQQAELTEV